MNLRNLFKRARRDYVKEIDNNIAELEAAPADDAIIAG